MLLPFAQLDFRGDTPISREYDDIYYNTQSGEAESDYVYLAGNDLPARFWGTKRFVVGEIGFGSGLNFLLTAKRFLETAPESHHLYYLSVEHRPWQLADLQTHHARFSFQLPEIQSALYAQYPHNHAGFHYLKLSPRVHLLLMLEDAQSALNDLSAQVDAWYLDGFSPSKNPDCWTAALFQKIAENSAPNATVASFSAARVVRDGLTQAGFTVEKRKGFAHKRDMLVGKLTQSALPPEHWSNTPQYAVADDAPVAVIGAGVAGASVARSLAESGREVWVFDDANRKPASRAPVVVPYLALDAQSALLARYQRHAYHHALRFYENSRHVAPMPLVQLPPNVRQARRYQEIFEQQSFNAETLGFQAEASALVFYRAGAIDAPALLDDLLAHERITRISEKVERLQDDENGVWVNQQRFAAAVLCSAWQVDLLQDDVLQSALRPVRGQGAVFEVAQGNALPSEILSADLTFIPMRDPKIYVGASFAPNCCDLSENAAENAALQSALNAYLGTQTHCPNEPQSALHAAFVGIRAATTDYQPLSGALPVRDDVVQKYQLLRFDVNRAKPQNVVQRRLFVHMGLGSKGFTQTWLSADLIAAEINHTPLPLPKALLAVLSPTRYYIRALSRRQI